MTAFFKIETVTAKTTVAPKVGGMYRFVGDSLSRRDDDTPFMIVRLVGGRDLAFSSGPRQLGWVPLDGPEAGTIFMFHDTEEVEGVDT